MGNCCDSPNSLEYSGSTRPKLHSGGPHPYANTLVSDFTVGGRTFRYYSLPALGDDRYAKLPYSIRVLLESAVRNCDNFNVKRKYNLRPLPL